VSLLKDHLYRERMFTLVLGASGHKGFCRTSENYMPSVDDVDQYHLGLEEFVKGDPEPVKKLFSIETA
jgi:hypothetical protein